MVPVRGITYEAGIAVTNTDANGLFAIPHGMGTASLSCLLTPKYAGPEPAAAYMALRIKLLVRSVETLQVVGWAVDTVAVGPITLAAIEVHYRFDRTDY